LLNRTFVRSISIVALVALVGSIVLGFLAGIARADAPELKVDAKSAILMDYATGQVLYEKDADVAIPPASLTKLMTLHLAFKKLADGTMKRTDKVIIRPEAWAASMPGSSVMFLEPGQNVTVWEIMQGIAIPSGNDAAVAMAQHIGGSVDGFVAMMNKEAQDMGYKTMHFADPAGLSAANVVTAREFADFARRYIQLHPEALTELHSKMDFTYPKPENLAPDKLSTKPITQPNRNSLLGQFDGVDGLKTGFIEESGYNIALTAKRGDMRLVAIILGVAGRDEVEGSRRRAEQGAATLAWGFQNFVTMKPPVPALATVRVWKGATNEVAIEPDQPIMLTIQRGLESKVTSTVTQESTKMAPIAKGEKLGELIYAAGGKEVARIKLVAANEVKQGGFFKRLWDSLRLWVSGKFTKKK
jgi:D-alanyl-D-alanine carboxypeptidase (penicillin-binding protein 5/6)